MRQENTFAGQPESNIANTHPGNAFAYLKSLPPNYDNPVLESYKKARDSQVIDHEIAEDFTSGFRSSTSSFFIPVSWSMTKASLVALLGITDYDGFPEVNGVRFYAGLNGDNQLTLVAVTTQAGEGCSNRGNLKVQNGPASMLEVEVKVSA